MNGVTLLIQKMTQNNRNILDELETFYKNRKTLLNSNEQTIKKLNKVLEISNYIFEITNQRSSIKISNENETLTILDSIKENIIQTLDLVALKEFSPAYKNLRTIIENTFRILLISEKNYIFRLRKEQKKFDATEIQIKIRSLVNTFKVRKLTEFANTYFSGTCISESIGILNNYYTKVSEFSHAQSSDNNMINSLQELSDFSDVDCQRNLNDIMNCLKNIFSVFYYSLNILFQTEIFSQQKFEMITEKIDDNKFERELENISSETNLKNTNLRINYKP